MFILVCPRDGGRLGVSVERPADCSSIHIEASGATAASTKHALLDAGAAVAIDGDQVLISAAWLRSRAGKLEDDPGWVRAFDAMVASASAGEPFLAALDALRVPQRDAADPDRPRR